MTAEKGDRASTRDDSSRQGSATAIGDRNEMTLDDMRNVSRPNATANDAVEQYFRTPEFVGIVRDGDDRKSDKIGEKLTPEERAAQEEAQKVADEHNVSVSARLVDGVMTYTFYTGIDGERREILQTDNPDYENEIEEYQRETTARLEDRYNLDISEDGETFEFTKNGNTTDKDARTPTLSELVALEEALKWSEPSNLTRDGEPLRVVYSARTNKPGAYAYFSARDDEPMIVFQPNSGARDVFSQVDTVTHEFAHHGDWQARENTDGLFSGLREAMLNSSLGYVRGEDGGWLLKSKDGGLYQYLPVDENKPNGDKMWFRRNEEGDYLDADGNVVDRDDAETFTRDEMRERHVHNPPTDYFVNPEEMWAEMQTYFRMGEERRGELYAIDPYLYRIAKQYDQQEINVFYPPREDGSPSYIRLPSGEIAPNTAANALLVLDYERGLRLECATTDSGKPKGGKIPGGIFGHASCCG